MEAATVAQSVDLDEITQQALFKAEKRDKKRQRKHKVSGRSVFLAYSEKLKREENVRRAARQS